MPNAVAYMRCSSEGQRDGDSFPRQRAEIVDYAARSDLEIIGWYQEAISGTVAVEKRLAFWRMFSTISDVEDPPVVIVSGLDRLARELVIQEKAIALLNEAGIPLVTADTGIMHANPNPKPAERFMRQVQGAMNELDKCNLVNRMRRGRDRKSEEQGYRCEGPPPYNQINIINKIIEWRGEKPKVSFREIARRLNEQEIPTHRSGDWYPSTVHKILRRHLKRCKQSLDS